MSINDCNQPIPGVQTVVTYTLDVGPAVVTDNSVNGAGWSTLLKSMAASSGGKYFPINNNDPNEAQAIQQALTTIFNEVQAVNSVFAATTLPVSVNVRGTNLNRFISVCSGRTRTSCHAGLATSRCTSSASTAPR